MWIPLMKRLTKSIKSRKQRPSSLRNFRALPQVETTVDRLPHSLSFSISFFLFKNKMISLLDSYLLHDLSKIVLEYVKFTEKQLDLIMNSKPLPYVYGERGHLNEEQLKECKTSCVLAGYEKMAEDQRFSMVFTMNNSESMMDILLVKTNDFSKYVKVTMAMRRKRYYQKNSIHFHGDTIVVATENEKDSKYQIYDFESFGEVF